MSDLRHDAPDVPGRREFTLQSALALLAGVVITVEGCGGSSNSPTGPTPSTAPAPAPAPLGDVSGSVSANHGHTAVVSSAQITAGNAFSLDIQGTATHPHTVQLSQADLGSLRSRTTVTKESTNNNGHTHTVTFTPM